MDLIPDTDDPDSPLPPSAFEARTYTTVIPDDKGHIFDYSEEPSQPRSKYQDSISPSEPTPSLQSKLTLSESRVLELEQELRGSRTEQLDLQHKHRTTSIELQQMRAYIGSSYQAKQKSVQSKGMQTEVINLADSVSIETESTDKMDQLMEDNSLLRRELQLALLRVQNLETVLQLQEKQLHRTCGIKTTGRQSPLSDHPTARSEQLLSSWRAQVMRLLMEAEKQKSQLQHALQQERNQRERLEEIEQTTALSEETFRLKLQSSEAAVLAEKERFSALERRFNLQSKRYQALKIQHHEHTNLAQNSLCSIRGQLAPLLDRLNTFWHPTRNPATQSTPVNSMPGICHRIQQLERRLVFATDRFPLLRASLAVQRIDSPGDRREHAVQTPRLPSSDAVVQGALSVSEADELIAHTKADAKLFRDERDLALRKLEQNAITFQQRVQAVQDEVRLEVISLREMTNMLEESLKEKEMKLNECQIEFESLRVDHSRTQEDAAEQRTHFHTQLSDAQKELAKIQAELNCAQRRADREVDERKVQVKEVERKYQMQIQLLEHALQSCQPKCAKPSQHSYVARKLETDRRVVEIGSPKSHDPSQLDALAKSLQQLQELAVCLKSESSSDSEETKLPTAS